MRVGILGFEGSGKTTLLGALLHHLARGGGKDSALAYHGLAGAESFRDLFGYAEVLEKGAWPHRTSVGRVAEYTLQLRERADVVLDTTGLTAAEPLGRSSTEPAVPSASVVETTWAPPVRVQPVPSKLPGV